MPILIANGLHLVTIPWSKTSCLYVTDWSVCQALDEFVSDKRRKNQPTLYFIHTFIDSVEYCSDIFFEKSFCCETQKGSFD